MKNLVYAFALTMLALGSCTETVYEEVIRYVDRPVPQFVETSKTEECVSTDTTKVEILIKDIIENGQIGKDTVLSVTTACHMKITVKGKVSVPHKEIHDSIPYYVYDSIPYPVFVEVPGPPPPAEIIYKDTTIIEQRVVYLSVEYVFPFNSVTFIPTDLQKYHDDYIAEATKRGKVLIGGDVIFSYVDPKDLPVEGSVSNTFEMAGNQQIIQLSSELIQEYSRAAVYREMNRWQLKKQYSNDVNKIMSPMFRTSPEPTVAEINQLFL